jgi:CBS domain-containing protein
MKNSKKVDNPPRLTLLADSAADLMSANPVSISAGAPVREAEAFLIDRGFSAAPVIDNAGRPIGVLSRSDLLVHNREKVDYVPDIHEYYAKTDLTSSSAENLKEGFQVENVERTTVRDIMTPVVFTVTPEAPVRKVVEEMLSLKVHRLFVVGRDGVLVGVISALDVLRHLGANKTPSKPVPVNV